MFRKTGLITLVALGFFFTQVSPSEAFHHRHRRHARASGCCGGGVPVVVQSSGCCGGGVVAPVYSGYGGYGSYGSYGSYGTYGAYGARPMRAGVYGSNWLGIAPYNPARTALWGNGVGWFR